MSVHPTIRPSIVTLVGPSVRNTSVKIAEFVEKIIIKVALNVRPNITTNKEQLFPKSVFDRHKTENLIM